MPPIHHVEEFCSGCALGKQHRTPFPEATTYRASGALELVDGDLCGPITPPTARGKEYFLLIVDDYSCFMWLEVLRSKDEALDFFKRVKALAKAERSCKLLAFRLDHGGEFNSLEFAEFCDGNGIKHQTTTPYSPQQNDMVERRNQTLLRWPTACSNLWACQGRSGEKPSRQQSIC
jgi:transposase InsO family protein